MVVQKEQIIINLNKGKAPGHMKVFELVLPPNE
jgi:hypothetical protein